MTRLTWADRKVVSGVQNGSVYVSEGAFSWSGLISVDEKGDDDFSATISAFTYPDVLEDYIGVNRSFGMSYVVTEGDNIQIHMLYNVKASESDVSYKTTFATLDPLIFAFDLVGAQEDQTWSRPASHLVVNTNYTRYADPVRILQDHLYGTATTDPYLPAATEVEELFESYTVMRIQHFEDRTWTATGPSNMVIPFDDGTFRIISESAYPAEDGVFIVSSY